VRACVRVWHAYNEWRTAIWPDRGSARRVEIDRDLGAKYSTSPRREDLVGANPELDGGAPQGQDLPADESMMGSPILQHMWSALFSLIRPESGTPFLRLQRPASSGSRLSLTSSKPLLSRFCTIFLLFFSHPSFSFSCP